MEYRNKYGKINPAEIEWLSKISDLVNEAKKKGWNDIVRESEQVNNHKTKTKLRSFYYQLFKMKRVAMEQAKTNQPMIQSSTQTTPISKAEATSSADGAQTQPATSIDDASDPLLSSPIIEREYTSATAGAPPTEPIPEPSAQAYTAPVEEKPEEPDTKFNEINDLPPAEKKRSAKAMAEMLVDQYCIRLPALCTWITQFPEDKLVQMGTSGELNLNLQVTVPTPTPHSVPLGKYITDLNSRAEEAFRMPADFKDNVLPPLTRVLEKKGMGMTDEQQLIYLVANDLLNKGAAVWSLKSDMKSMIEYMKEMSRMYPANGQRTTKEPEPAPSPQGSAEHSSSQHHAAHSTANGMLNQEPIPTVAEDVGFSDH